MRLYQTTLLIVAMIVLGPSTVNSLGNSHVDSKNIGVFDGPGHVLATCKLSAATHEAAEGFFNCEKFGVSVPRTGIPADILREHVGKDVEIVIRMQEPRRLQTVVR